VGRALSCRRAGRDGRPILAAASAAEPDTAAGGAQDRAPSLEAAARADQIGDRLGMPASTVHAVLVRCRLHRLCHVDRATGELIRRYEHAHPGDMLHMDVKKLGRVPDDGGWRFVGHRQGGRNRAKTAARTGASKNIYSQPLIGTCYLLLTSSTTTPVSPTSRPATMRPRKPLPRYCAPRWPGSPNAASASSAS